MWLKSSANCCKCRGLSATFLPRFPNAYASVSRLERDANLLRSSYYVICDSISYLHYNNRAVLFLLGAYGRRDIMQICPQSTKILLEASQLNDNNLMNSRVCALESPNQTHKQLGKSRLYDQRPLATRQTLCKRSPNRNCPGFIHPGI